MPVSLFYRKSVRNHRRDERLMKVLEPLHLEDPIRGTRRLTKELNKHEHDVGRDKIRSLMARMNMKTIYRVPVSSDDWVSAIKSLETVRISMDGKGRTLDNVYIERFYGTLKYEKLYIQSSSSPTELRKACKEFVY